MHKLLFFCVILSIAELSCTSSCEKKTALAPKENNSEFAAEVNGQKITQSKLDTLSAGAELQMSRTGHKLDDGLKKRIRASILKKMIDDEVLKQKADSLGIKIDRFERTEGLERYKARLGGEQAFQAFIKQRGLSEEQVIESVIQDLTRTKLAEKIGEKTDLSDDDIKAHYENNPKIYTMPPMVRARHILLKVNKTDPEEKAALVLKKAKHVLSLAQEEGASFSDLAQKYSEGPSVNQGGDVGYFARGRMVKEFEDAAFDAPLKTAVGPVKTEYGYHLIYVEDKRKEMVAPLAEVRGRIVEHLTQSRKAHKAENILLTLRKSAHVKIYDDSLTEPEYKGKKEEEVAAKGYEKDSGDKS